MISAQPAVSSLEHAWTPAARALARLLRVEQLDAGTMHHFTTALLLGDLVTRLHTVLAVSLLAKFDEVSARRYCYELVRTSGTGDWIEALKGASGRVKDKPLREPLPTILTWVRESVPQEEMDRFGD